MPSSLLWRVFCSPPTGSSSSSRHHSHHHHHQIHHHLLSRSNPNLHHHRRQQTYVVARVVRVRRVTATSLCAFNHKKTPLLSTKKKLRLRRNCSRSSSPSSAPRAALHVSPPPKAAIKGRRASPTKKRGTAATTTATTTTRRSALRKDAEVKEDVAQLKDSQKKKPDGVATATIDISDHLDEDVKPERWSSRIGKLVQERRRGMQKVRDDAFTVTGNLLQKLQGTLVPTKQQHGDHGEVAEKATEETATTSDKPEPAAKNSAVAAPKTLHNSADEHHFVPVGNGAWEICLHRYVPRSKRSNTPPVLLVPGCASNARSFDLTPSASLARYLADGGPLGSDGMDVWVVELRGIGRSRLAQTDDEGKDKDEKGGASSYSNAQVYGWNFDTHLKEDLPAAAAYVGKVTGAKSLSGIGHSMGGMLLLSALATSSWKTPLKFVITLASCLRVPAEESGYGFAIYLGELLRKARAAHALGVPVRAVSMLQSASIGATSAPLRKGPEGQTKLPRFADTWATTLREFAHGSTANPAATPTPLVRRLLSEGFEDVPISLLAQMSTLFESSGMRPSSWTVQSKLPKDDDHYAESCEMPYIHAVRLHAASRKPTDPTDFVAFAANADAIFPPKYVRETVEAGNGRFVLVGDREDGYTNDFRHYDLLTSTLARVEVFPMIWDALMDGRMAAGYDVDDVAPKVDDLDMAASTR